jgi:hypothetical protein
MDPLALLRDASMAGALGQVTEADGRITFGDRYSFPKVGVDGLRLHAFLPWQPP